MLSTSKYCKYQREFVDAIVRIHLILICFAFLQRFDECPFDTRNHWGVVGNSYGGESVHAKPSRQITRHFAEKEVAEKCGKLAFCES